jgi:hypothetical protein
MLVTCPIASFFSRENRTNKSLLHIDRLLGVYFKNVAGVTMHIVSGELALREMRPVSQTSSP